MANTKTAPFTTAEWIHLKQCARILHKWYEDECNGAIQWEGENEDIPRRYFLDRYGSYTVPGSIIRNAAKSYQESARAIAGRHGLSVYNQTDPRGCALYVYSAADLRGRDINECYSMLAQPVI